MGFSYTGFNALLKQQFTELPSVEFMESSAFSRVHQFFMEHLQLDLDSATTDEEIIDTVISQLEALMVNPNHVSTTTTLDLSAGKLTQEVSGAFNLLRHNVSDLVSSLSAEIGAAQGIELRRAGAEVLVSESAAPSTDFGVLQWGQLQTRLYVGEVIDATCRACDILNKEISPSNVVYALRKLPLPDFKEIDLNEDAKNDLLDKLTRVVTSSNRDEIAGVFSAVISGSEFNRHCNELKAWANETPDGYSNVLSRTKLITQVVKGLATIPIDLATETMTSLTHNINLLRTANYIGEFYLIDIMMKREGILILSKNLLNGPEVAKLTAAGGSFADVAYHIRAGYEGREIPMTGISTARVLEFRENVNKTIAEQNANLMTKMKIVKSKAMNKAYHNVLNTYLLSLTPEVLPENISLKDFYQTHYPKIVNTLDRFRSKQDNVEDALYAFILQVWHNNSLVQTLYNYLGREYTKLAESENGAADDSAVANVDAYVVSTLVGEYITKRHCKLSTR